MADGKPPDIAVRVNNQPLRQRVLSDIREVTVEESLDAFDMFTISLCNWDAERQRVSWSDDPLFAVGGRVVVSLGYVDDLHPVMTGEIASIEPTFEAGQVPLLTVRGYDRGLRLARGTKTRNFRHGTDSDIACWVARNARLVPRATDSGESLTIVVQDNESDWDFLRRRARRIGYEVYVRGRDLYFRPPQHAAGASATLTLGAEIVSFTPRLNLLGQVDRVVVSGVDTQGQSVQGEAGVHDLDKMGGTNSGAEASRRVFGSKTETVVDESVKTKAEADLIALGHLNHLALKYVKGEVVCGGLPELHAGTVVEIQGAGRTFSGRYYVTAVTHSSSREKGYRTTLTARRTAT